MSIMQDWKSARRYFGKKKYESILEFLEEHPEYTLDDTIYNRETWKIYEKWKAAH